MIKASDSSKAHSWGNVSTKMIKICGESITVPLKIIFEQMLKEKKFPELWKKANTVPVHKKEGKSLIKNYRSVSLLPSLIILKAINFLHLLNQVFCQATYV